MYRLLNLRNVNLNSLTGVSLVRNGNHGRNCAARICNLCHQIHFNSLIRFQSTSTNPNVSTKKVKKKRKVIKRYSDMMIVRDSSTSQCKAKIETLKANDIKLLALTNLNLNELHKLRKLVENTNVSIAIPSEHTYNNLADERNLPNIHQSVNVDEALPNLSAVIDKEINYRPELYEDMKEDEEIISVEMAEEDLDGIKLNSTFQPEVEDEETAVEVEEIDKTKKKSDHRAKHEMISRALSSYIETCVSLKHPQKGLNALHFYRHRSKKMLERFPHIKSINVYNELLKGFAAKGDFPKIREVLRYLEEEGVSLNVQSFVAIFECLGRLPLSNSNRNKFIDLYVNEAFKLGITFDEILNKGIFLFDQRARVLDILAQYDPKYEPTYHTPKVQYNNHLVDHLNHNDQLRAPPLVKHSNNSKIFSKEFLKSCVQKQVEIEKDVFVWVKSIETKGDITDEIKHYREVWSDHLKMWEDSANDAYNRDLLALTAQRSAVNLEPYMRCIPTKDCIKIVVDEAVRIAQGSETYSPSINMLYKELGLKVYGRYKVLKKQKSGVLDKITGVHNKYCEHYSNSHLKLDVLPDNIDNLNPRQKWQWAENSLIREGATINMDHQEWTQTAITSVGKFLYNIIMHDLKVDVNALRDNTKHKNYLPAFYTIFRNQGRAVKEEVKPHPILSKLYRASVPEMLSFPAYELPIKCPPVPWTSVHNGGYLIAPCEVIRLPIQASTQKLRLKQTSPNKLYPSFDALNQLAAVPWKVNHKVLDVILTVFRNGGSDKLDVPEVPSNLESPPNATPDMNKTQRYALFKQKLQYRRRKAEMYSLWCDCLYRLSLANHFKDDVFWLPHNMDFRGRVYPIPPHLNHLGSDLARSMLVFAEARPLGPNGLDWLKIHLINLTGLLKKDKVSARLAYANEIIEDILDSADNPLDGRMWWSKSDEPWQTLACCMEIAAAHRSSDHEKYLSHFPVHQDGSCNGLQHYAALGRDSAGAFSVNLSPAEYPQDVYSAVAILVEERRKADAENGVEIAKILDGFVRRKVIKQTVMTTVYGVTRFGARLQIARQLKDIEDFPKESVWAASSYLTARTFDSLRTMFTSTREIQDWFTECARLISSVCSKNVEWITPLGLPVVQPYFRYKKLSGSTGFEPFQIEQFEKPNIMKQKNAFPPNFIHSLDSSHMMLTSLNCERTGITFVSVHDCYWTHPSTVHIMNKICREQFVALHSEPILEDLSTFLGEMYSFDAEEITNDGSVMELTKRKLNRVLRKLPKTGKFDINHVLNSVYFFS